MFLFASRKSQYNLLFTEADDICNFIIYIYLYRYLAVQWKGGDGGVGVMICYLRSKIVLLEGTFSLKCGRATIVTPR